MYVFRTGMQVLGTIGAVAVHRVNEAACSWCACAPLAFGRSGGHIVPIQATVFEADVLRVCVGSGILCTVMSGKWAPSACHQKDNSRSRMFLGEVNRRFPSRGHSIRSDLEWHRPFVFVRVSRHL